MSSATVSQVPKVAIANKFIRFTAGLVNKLPGQSFTHEKVLLRGDEVDKEIKLKNVVKFPNAHTLVIDPQIPVRFIPRYVNRTTFPNLKTLVMKSLPLNGTAVPFMQYWNSISEEDFLHTTLGLNTQNGISIKITDINPDFETIGDIEHITYDEFNKLIHEFAHNSDQVNLKNETITGRFGSNPIKEYKNIKDWDDTIPPEFQWVDY